MKDLTKFVRCDGCGKDLTGEDFFINDVEPDSSYCKTCQDVRYPTAVEPKKRKPGAKV